MAHIAVVSAPYPGHLNPSLSLAGQLVRRGHQVTVPAPERYAGKVLGTGAELISYRSPLAETPLVHHEDLSVMMPCLLSEAQEVFAAVEAGLGERPPDGVVFDVLAWGGLMFAARHGSIDIQTWPFFASNEHFSLESRYTRSVDDPSALEAFYEELISFAAEMGIPDVVSRMFDGIDRNIVFIPREFQYRGETFDDRYAFAGPCFLPEADELPSTRDRTDVVMSMGTTHTLGVDFFDKCLSAAEDLPHHVVITTGADIDARDLGPVPANAEVLSDVPSLHAALVPAAVLVTHGGMNSIMEAIDRQVPMVVLPQSQEQVVNADRVVELGLGVTLATHCTAGELAAAVQAVGADTSVFEPLARMGRALKAAGGRDRAARQVEMWVGLG